MRGLSMSPPQRPFLVSVGTRVAVERGVASPPALRDMPPPNQSPPHLRPDPFDLPLCVSVRLGLGLCFP